MIYGIGTDIVRIDRVAAVYARFGARFTARLLLDEEAAEFARTRNRDRFLAMRFAGKEAIVKAMGTGFRHGIWIRDVGIRHNRWGRPEVIFSPRARELCDRLGIGVAHVSLSDEGGMAQAFAVAECRRSEALRP